MAVRGAAAANSVSACLPEHCCACQRGCLRYPPRLCIVPLFSSLLYCLPPYTATPGPLPPPLQWPSLLRPLSPILNEMPGMVLERYAACQTVAFCGVFPEIRRAWASVDNSLFLWRFDKWWVGPG